MGKTQYLPAVGIRPTIDGRRQGVRESLEESTLAMAQRCADFLSKHIRYPSGEALRCVIADTCIGGIAEASACDEKFRDEHVGLTITLSSCWCYGSETLDMDPFRPKAVWGFNGTERPGAVYLAAALAGHNQKGLPAFSIYGKDVQDASDTEIPQDVQEKLLRFVRSGLACALLRGKSYLSLGGCSMGIAGSIVDQAFFERYLGMKVQAVDMTELRRRMDKGIYNKAELKKAFDWAKENFIMGTDKNPVERQRNPGQKDQVLKQCLLMTMVIRDMMKGNSGLKRNFGEEASGYNAILAGFQGQRHWTDQYPNGDVAEALLNSSFDWNGIREPLVVATENDSLNGLCQLFGHLLTGTPGIFADVRTYWSPLAVKRVSGKTLSGPAAQGMIHLINSGSAALDGSGAMKDAAGKACLKPFWEVNQDDVDACLKATSWWPAIDEYFRGGGFSSKFLTKGGLPFTLSRLNLVEGLGPVLQIAEGWSVEIDPEIHKILDQRTDSSWPTTWFVPRLNGKGAFKDVYSLMANWGANHGVLTYGHVGADFISLAAMLRIPVSLHNLDEDQIFRPSAWAAFGMDSEGADYRACANYGPLYR